MQSGTPNSIDLLSLTQRVRIQDMECCTITVEASTHVPAVQLMVNPAIIARSQAVCRRKKGISKTAVSLAAVEEDVTADSDESAFMIEQVGAVHHNKKGQYFATLEFVSTSGKVVLDCQLDTGVM